MAGGTRSFTLAWEDQQHVLATGTFNDLVFEISLGTGVPGDDVIRGGEGSDTVGFDGDIGGVAVNLAAGRASGKWIGQDRLRDIENATSGDGDDTMSG